MSIVVEVSNRLLYDRAEFVLRLINCRYRNMNKSTGTGITRIAILITLALIVLTACGGGEGSSGGGATTPLPNCVLDTDVLDSCKLG